MKNKNDYLTKISLTYARKRDKIVKKYGYVGSEKWCRHIFPIMKNKGRIGGFMKNKRVYINNGKTKIEIDSKLDEINREIEQSVTNNTPVTVEAITIARFMDYLQERLRDQYLNAEINEYQFMTLFVFLQEGYIRYENEQNK
jgi:hypothetical protein